MKSAWGNADPQLERSIQQQLDTAREVYIADPALMREHANQEASFRTSGYSLRQVTELIQNATDAITRSGRSGRIELILTPTTLYCANEGDPFDRNGIEAVTHAYLSGKDKDQIGRYGLGFKSVLSVTSNAQVFSRTASFEFGSENAKSTLHALSPGPVPLLRIPTLLDAQTAFDTDEELRNLAAWATTVVKLPLLSNVGLLTQMAGFNTAFLLFAPKVEALTMTVVDEMGNRNTAAHKCKKISDNTYQLIKPSGDVEEWQVISRPHKPTMKARDQIATGSTRESFTISFATTVDGPPEMGAFWANFPLFEETSARGLFNAPWALNEDRTSILEEKEYNREIIASFVEMFVDSLTALSSRERPGHHLGYLPSRIRETKGPVDRRLISNIQYLAARGSLIPDMDGVLRNGTELRALNHGTVVPLELHEEWKRSRAADRQLPHPSCYTDATVRARLRDLHRQSFLSPTQRLTGNEEPVEGAEIPLSAWLTELASDSDSKVALHCLEVISRTSEDIQSSARSAAVVPLRSGSRARLSDKATVFLPPDGQVEIPPDIAVVADQVMSSPPARKLLQRFEFERLDYSSILKSRLRSLDEDSAPADWERLWDLVDDVEPVRAELILRRHVEQGQPVLVRTVSGIWRVSRECIDLSARGIVDVWPERTVARSSVNQSLYGALRITTSADRHWPVIEEDAFQNYRDYCSNRKEAYGKPGTFDQERSPGPIGLLKAFTESNDRPSSVVWTRELVSTDANREWWFRPVSADAFKVPAPHLWAALEWGWADTTFGVRRISDSAHPSLARFGRFFPVLVRSEFGKLPLAQSISEMSPQSIYDIVADKHEFDLDTNTQYALGELVRIAIEHHRAAGTRLEGSVPATVGRRIASRDASSVFLTSSEEEQTLLEQQSTPYIFIQDPDLLNEMLSVSTFRSAADSIQVKVQPEGLNKPSAPLSDVMPSLIPYLSASPYAKVQVQECTDVLIRRVTPAGTIDESARRYLSADTIYVTYDPSSSSARSDFIKWLNLELALGLSAIEQERLLNQIDDAETRSLKERCRSCGDDTDRLRVLFTAEQLKSKLPIGLMTTLEVMGTPVRNEQIAELFSSCHGFESLHEMRSELLSLRLTPPEKWSGNGPARRFVQDLGFDVRFAGETSPTLPDTQIVLGKPGLGGLHDYQESAVREIRFLLRSRHGNADKAMIELPTGAGKTRVAVEAIVRAFLNDDFDEPAHMLWIAQTKELCEQTITTWNEVWREFSDHRPLSINRFFDGHVPDRPDTEFSVVVSTDAMLEEHLNDYESAWIYDPQAVVVDEAHRAATSRRYTAIFARLGVGLNGKERPLLGLSATPFRPSPEANERLARLFGKNLVKSLGDNPVAELQRRGVLAEIEHDVLPGTTITLDAQEQKTNSLSRSTLNRVADDQQRTRRIVEHIKGQSRDWSILVFMPSVLSAQVLASVLRTSGYKADSVSGSSSRRHRARVIDAFRSGDIQVLVNCDLLTQGFDAPMVRALYVAKPTLSQSQYVQMVGRGLRGPANNGSEKCLVVDLEDTVANPDVDINLAYRGFEEYWNRS